MSLSFRTRRNLITTAVLVLVAVGPFGDSAAQSSVGSEGYVWPTDASQFLTSAFCEYRGRRFHAGIDIKTWGRTGYKVFAIRPGYVWRISVSPYGYGKSVYLKLDTGEIAQYAHLSKYADKIQEMVEREQQRLGRYRINKYLKPGQFPVRQGEVIAYTGQTGIGAPHLHFEIRDSANRPINPLSKGFELPDRTSPIITKVSVSPLDATSQVNGDFEPIVLKPKWEKPGIYALEETPIIWGNAGLAVACYDKDSNSTNSFGLYSFKLYVDDVLRFQYRFDRVSFQENRMVELERDYRLYRRGLGRFHKLYKAKHNSRSHYQPNRTWAGVLKSASLAAKPSLHSELRTNPAASADLESGALFPGLHDFRIEVSDFFGNVSTVQGQFQVGEFFTIQPILSDGDDGSLNLQDVVSYDLRSIRKVNTSMLSGKRWRTLNVDDSGIFEDVAEKGGEAGPEDGDEPSGGEVVLLKTAPSRSLIMRFEAKDQFDVPSYPYYYVRAQGSVEVSPELTVSQEYYDAYLRIEVNSTRVLMDGPKATLYPEQSDFVNVVLHQVGLTKYAGRIAFDQLHGNHHVLRLVAQGLGGDAVVYQETLDVRKIDAKSDAIVFSEGGDFSVAFWPGSLYDAIHGYVYTDSLSNRESNMVGQIYHAEPQEAPLNAGAKVSLVYPQDVPDPEKLGVYYRTRRGRWVFVDNELDMAKRSVSAKVFSLEKFVLMRDNIAPEIARFRPRNRDRLSNTTPRISVNVRDTGSGIESENDIVLRLDGKKLIAEYDPERDRIFYQVKKPLAKGEHSLSVWVKDRSKNEASRKWSFWIN